MSTGTPAFTLSLRDPRATDPAVAGSKAAALARLLRAGLPVLDGVVVPTGVPRSAADVAGAAVPGAVAVEILDALGDRALAVRSSAVAEDTPEASCAGLYTTVLDVRGAERIADALARCWGSARGAGLPADRSAGDGPAHGGNGTAMGVLVQPLLEPRAAGAAFVPPAPGTAVVVSAVSGRAADLMAGEVVGDEWRVGGDAEPVRLVHHAIDAAQAQAVAALGRRVAGELGVAVEIEWALCDGELVLLQARPQTGLPPVEVTWPPPGRGEWRRDIRLGEWLPEPVTPLFATWFLPAVDRRFRAIQARRSGVVLPRPAYAVVHGWYYHSPLGDRRSWVLVRGLVARPRFAVGMMLARRRPDLAHRLVGRSEIALQRAVLARYRTAVAALEAAVATADDRTVLAHVDAVVDVVGEYTWCLAMLGGAAWRAERALARLHDHDVRPAVHEPYLGLLLEPRAEAPVAGHAVSSLDWVHPTLGELRAASGAVPAGPPTDAAGDRAAGLEAACRAALSGRPRRLRRFAAVLALARASAARRRACAAELTLAWPVLRRAILRIGEGLRERGCVADADDVFFLERDEVVRGLARDGARPDGRVRARRAVWDEQRRRTAPVALGVRAVLLPLLVPSSRPRPRRRERGVLVGIAVSPGRATGRARVVSRIGPDVAFDDGDVLVTRALVPALAPLLTRAAAVVADVGSVAAHMSVLAREYRVPGVVGLGTATASVRDGQLVTVDGAEGTVELVTGAPRAG